MKVIVAGSRSIKDFYIVVNAIDASPFKGSITEVVSGTARGVDMLGELYAHYLNLNVRRFPADWKHFGKSAGYKRNDEMAEYADALIAVWDGISAGTRHMIQAMWLLYKPVYVHRLRVERTTKGA